MTVLKEYVNVDEFTAATIDKMKNEHISSQNNVMKLQEDLIIS